MKAYELLFFVDPSLDPETRLAVMKRIDTTIAEGAGKVDSVDEWGKRKLAYEINDLTDGDYTLINFHADPTQIAVPNDTTNEARALLLLEAQGLIGLKEGAGLTATKQDIVDNPRNFDIIEMEAAQLPRSLQDVDLAVINGNYAIAAGLKVADALVCEDSESIGATTYGNVVAVQKGHENDEKIKALVDALKSGEVKKFIEETYEGAVVPLS